MFKLGIHLRMIISFLILITVSISILGAYLLHFFYAQNLETKTTHLITSAKIIETTLENALNNPAKQKEIDEEIKKISNLTGLRITILDLQGNVAADSWENANDLSNHGDRPEVQSAFHRDYASAIRYSTTTKQNMLYVAVPVYHNKQLMGIVRTASALTPIETSYQSTRTFLITALIITILLTILVGIWLAHLYTKPIKEMTAIAQKIAGGDLAMRIHIHTNDELEVLAHAVNTLTSTLEDKIIEIDAEAKKLSLILEHMDNAVILLDSYGNVTTANRSAERIFHITSDLMGKHSISVIGNSTLTETAQEVLASRQSKSISLKIKLGNTPKMFQVFFAPMMNQEKNTAGVLSVFHDISVLQEIYDRQVEFVANASHELKTPLTSIKGFAETLLDGALENPALGKKFVGIIHNESERMSRLIEDLLQLAKLDTVEYRRQIKLEPIDMQEICKAAARKLAPQLKQKEQNFLIALPDEPLLIQANDGWIMQLMINLVENAIKYTPIQGQISLKCWVKDEHMFVSIKDSGIGIAPQDLPFIFERFYRTDKARARSEGGSGIGLSLVRFIVEMFGGKITAESRVNIGTTFTFYLPIAKSSKKDR